MRLNLLFIGLVLLALSVAYNPISHVAQANQLSQTSDDFDCSQVSEISHAECEALVALYNATNGPAWNNQHRWLVTNTPCNWYGIDCSSGVVIRIGLEDNNISGAVSPEIGNLSNLQHLNLDGNQLTTLPSEIGNLANLQSLLLYENQLYRDRYENRSFWGVEHGLGE